MKITFKIFTLFVLLGTAADPGRSGIRTGTEPGWGAGHLWQQLTLETGDTFEGDLVVFGGNVTIEEDADLNGNLVVIGGTINSNGKMNGDVVVIGGQVRLERIGTGEPVTWLPSAVRLDAGGRRGRRG